MARWNVMIFFAGDNNLSEEMVWALTDLKDTLENSVIGEHEVCVQFDPWVCGIPVQRYRFNKSTLNRGTKSLCEYAEPIRKADSGKFLEFIKKSPVKESLILSQCVKNLGIDDPADPKISKTLKKAVKSPDFSKLYYDLEDTGNPLTLLNFIYWAMEDKKQPEWKHMLILSGHSSGAENYFLNDDSTQNALTIRELSTLLKAAGGFAHTGKIDIIGLDSCLMASAEVYYQLGGHANFLVAAEGFEPNSGWPYGNVLKGLIAEASPGTGDETMRVARRIVTDYARFYFEYALCGMSVDLSACDVRKRGGLRDPVTDLANALTAVLKKETFADLIVLAHWKAQSYKSDQYVDLADFAEQLKAAFTRSPYANEQPAKKILSVCNDLETAIKDIAKATAYTGPDCQFSKGLSIYLPWSEDSWLAAAKRYGLLRFARATGWHQFLNNYVGYTRRLKRPGSVPADDFLVRFCQLDRLQKIGSRGSYANSFNFRYDPPHNRFDPPHNRFDPAHNRGKFAAASMKNMPHDWCLQKELKGGLFGLHKFRSSTLRKKP